MTAMTKRQIEALHAAIVKGGAAYLRGGNMGGAKRRMIDRMIADGLLDDCPPFAATPEGLRVHGECNDGSTP